MDTTQAVVTIIGVALIILTAYTFLAPHTIARTAEQHNGMQHQTIVVQGGYTPDTVRVKSGSPVQLVFDRKENIVCSSELVIPEFGIKRRLTAFGKTTIEFTPDKPGTYPFSCGMNMLHGTIIVE